MEATKIQRRKFHSKSRRGCLACKTRRIKCDEQGPPCANCVVRKSECTYPAPKSSKPASKKPLAPASGSGVSAKASSSTDGSLTLPRLAAAPGSSLFVANTTSPESSERSLTLSRQPSPSLNIHASLSPSPSAYSSSSSTNIALELELMHQWSTHTWKSIHFMPGEESFLQVDLPRLALRHGYMMDGLMATAAVDLAIASRQSNPTASTAYLCTAIERSNRASAGFRDELRNINRDNLYILYYFSTMAAHFNFITPGLPLTPLQQTDMFFTMIWGAVHIGMVNVQWLIESPTQLAASFAYAANVRMELFDLLDPETTEAISRMSSVIRGARLPSKDDGPGPLAIENFGYQMATGQTKYAFAEGDEGYRRGNFLGALVAAGPDFIDAIRNREHVALFLTMYWAVLVHRVGVADPYKTWWIGSKGADLIDEISGILVTSWLGKRSDVREGIAWTRLQVGLTPVEGCIWSYPFSGLDITALDVAGLDI
ncbi:hypothetical protein F5X68DRAFT_74415 [Plectosphaerella plurivora]|uniref:Zn(2)-C6 fungal-type domain-containing protein n=1 Tax=Plectosphaerella plurivora TaxID=936078 RepID=A0A9P8VDV8_9PEZI|nr:hypothetical protein F5X68DRAFT_74415 [Plectosphaerella plurivora]